MGDLREILNTALTTGSDRLERPLWVAGPRSQSKVIRYRVTCLETPERDSSCLETPERDSSKSCSCNTQQRVPKSSSVQTEELLGPDTRQAQSSRQQPSTKSTATRRHRCKESFTEARSNIRKPLQCSIERKQRCTTLYIA